MLSDLRRQLGAYYLAVLAVAITLYAGSSYVFARWAMYEALDDANARLLRATASVYETTTESMPQLYHEFTEFDLDPGERAAVLALDGRVRFFRGTGPAPDHLPTRRGASDDGRLRVMTRPLVRGGREVALLYVASSTERERRALGAMAFAFALGAPFGLALAGVAGWFIARRAARPVEEAIDRERQFTRDASHELRTPLSVIQLDTQLALRVGGLPAEAAGHLARAEAAVRRMGVLVDELLALAREDAGIQGKPLRFMLADLVEEELEALAPLAAARGVTLAAELGAPDAAVSGEPVQLARAVRNLLDNAIRYTAPGGRVAVRLAADGAQWLLAVSNPGPTLAGPERDQVFERFHRTDAGRAANPDGTGLGLAITRAIARAHGGSVAWRPGEPDGNTFELRVPAARA